jgi:hypothetical protein
MRSFLVVSDQGQKVQLCVLALKKNMHLPKSKKVKAKKNSRMSRGLHPC